MLRVRDDLSLDANSYQIKIGHTIVAEDKIYADRKLAMPGDDTQLKIQGIQVKDPSFGLEAIGGETLSSKSRDKPLHGYRT